LNTNTLAETHAPLSTHQALTEANRCLYCFDAPCTHACPTHIDVPRFIKRIAGENLNGAADAIFEANLLGATCSRVCPVEELCEGACVLGAGHQPISIGRLQRYVMDHAYATGRFVAPRAASGHRIAVIGSGPAGLSCAGELARLGHAVRIFEKRGLPGGLSTYGIIVLREPMEVALNEAAMIERLGVRIERNAELGRNLDFEDLRTRFEAVFVSIGLGSTPKLNIPGEDLILDGLQYIEQSKLDSSAVPPGRNVAIIGAGNTAIDCATIASRLGAKRVTIVYRRSPQEVTSYPHEIEFARKEGIEFRFFWQPVAVTPSGLQCVRTELGAPDSSGRRIPVPVPGSQFLLPADQVIKAIGQEKPMLPGVEIESGFIKVDENCETSIPRVFAGGDCIRGKGSASTVMAVQDGKLAAAAIHRRIMSATQNG
jgi:dihydropyrimidine dehydrogenase (NAD+) subunit PreT